jgi:hypothetical protein
MCDGDGRTVLRGPIECSLDDLLAFRINGTGGFVEDDDVGLLDDASRDC